MIWKSFFGPFEGEGAVFWREFFFLAGVFLGVNFFFWGPFFCNRYGFLGCFFGGNFDLARDFLRGFCGIL